MLCQDENDTNEKRYCSTYFLRPREEIQGLLGANDEEDTDYEENVGHGQKRGIEEGHHAQEEEKRTRCCKEDAKALCLR